MRAWIESPRRSTVEEFKDWEEARSAYEEACREFEATDEVVAWQSRYPVRRIVQKGMEVSLYGEEA